ncbi:hypothetical protein H2200_013623 [Cladophialophora chaetospira]|uniref:Uncharacterized protein n=1 Tax=Cladophialophora chaetospira TaxID=386627 RepID=A0AA38TYS5_9EURO|nr:hypothetical protein H2200_013623 [Cladophialophora chaetospira]
MRESHITYHLCGHVKTKTIVQCADIIDNLIASGQPITRSHQVCEDDVSENVHIFPDICDKCKKTGVIGDFMEVPGVKYEVFKAWEAKRKETLTKKDSESDEIKDLETLESIPIPEDATPTSEIGTTVASPSQVSQASSTTLNKTTPDLGQLKTRVAALRTRTDRLLTKIRAQKPPSLG